MGDYVHTTFQVFGDMTRETAEAADAEAMRWFDDEWSDAAATGRGIYAGQRNYGCADQFEAWCKERGIAYHLEWEAGCDYPAGRKYWRPGMEEPDESDLSSGEPTIGLPALKAALADGGTLESVIASLTPATMDAMPPLRIVESPHSPSGESERERVPVASDVEW